MDSARYLVRSFFSDAVYALYDRVPRRTARGIVLAPVEPQAGDDFGAGDQGHASEEQDGPANGHQAQGLSRRQASPPGADAGGVGSGVKASGQWTVNS